jgi:hypothetical protein
MATQAQTDALIEKYAKDNAGNMTDAEFAALVDQHSKGGSADNQVDRWGLGNFGQWNNIMGGGYGASEPDGTLGQGTGHLTPGGASGQGVYDPNNPYVGDVDENGDYVPGVDIFKPNKGPGPDPTSNTGGGSNTSWDWSNFGSSLPQAGEGAPPYTPDYTLGEESPWGTEGSEGGNNEFYNKQFNNLTRQSQAHQGQQFAAGLRRLASEQNPKEAPAMDWSWVNNGQGLPEVSVQGEVGSPRYGLREGFTGDTTNFEIMNAALGAGWNDNDGGYPISADNPQLTGTNWANATSPSDLYASMPEGADPTWAQMLRKGMNYTFTDSNIESPAGGGPVAAPGYASPIGSK